MWKKRLYSHPDPFVIGLNETPNFGTSETFIEIRFWCRVIQDQLNLMSCFNSMCDLRSFAGDNGRVKYKKIHLIVQLFQLNNWK